MRVPPCICCRGFGAGNVQLIASCPAMYGPCRSDGRLGQPLVPGARAWAQVADCVAGGLAIRPFPRQAALAMHEARHDPQSSAGDGRPPRCRAGTSSHRWARSIRALAERGAVAPHPSSQRTSNDDEGHPFLATALRAALARRWPCRKLLPLAAGRSCASARALEGGRRSPPTVGAAAPPRSPFNGHNVLAGGAAAPPAGRRRV
eukprot:scaffold1762_cov383-Prasinococcus_capsulatus_cf.AAC.17